MRFFKFHSQGNDCILVNIKEIPLDCVRDIARKVLKRRFGVGGDILVIFDEDNNSLRFFNPDGSEAEICGNSLLCYGLYLKVFRGQRGLLTVRTLSGEIQISIGEKVEVTFNISSFDFEEKILNLEEWEVKGYFTTSVGNPHFILVNPDIPFELAPLIEKHPEFPNGTNVEFTEVRYRKRVYYRIWERGAGETFSCASGALSAYVVLKLLDYIDKFCEFESKGGILAVEEREGKFILKGNPHFVFKGEIELSG